jgi:hypothetical protein
MFPCEDKGKSVPLTRLTNKIARANKGQANREQVSKELKIVISTIKIWKEDLETPINP